MPQQKPPPKYSGILQTGAKNPRFRKKLGRITLWENHSENPKAPILCGRIETNYGKSLVALWEFTPRKRTE